MASRRDFLRLSAAAGAAGLLPRAALGRDEFGGFRMGLQTYSLRAFDLDACLGIVRDLGLKYLQFYSGKQARVTDDPDAVAALKRKLDAAGMRVPAWGVERFGKDDAANRRVFAFARAMGVSTLVASPSPDSFGSLAALVKEFGVRIAIHNHGPEDKSYGRLEQVLRAVERLPLEIGACVDTGHALRAGEDPVAWIRALGPRVHDVHLKDASGPQAYHVLGEGKLDLLGTLRALRDIKFDGLLALEYELNEKNPVDDIRRCLVAAREACTKL